MIVLTVTRRCLRHDGSIGVKAVIVEMTGNAPDGGAVTASIHPNGCRGQPTSAVLMRTPALVGADHAIRTLVEEVRTALGDYR